MANLQVTYFSPSIMRFTTFQMVLPNDTPPAMKENNRHYDRPMKTLFLLHGFSGCSVDWVTGSLINELAGRYNLAVVMPSGDNSFYLNGAGSCNKYEDFLCGDLVAYIRDTFGLAKTPEDTVIGGLSMGGFGAIHSGLAHPDVFGKMFGLSSALICDTIQGMKPGSADGIADYDYYRQVFGDLDHLDESPKNPKYLVKQRVAKGEKIRPVFMACGSEDFLIENNRDFHEFLVKHGVDVTYRESPGVHEWKFWNEYIEPAIEWALKK
ncbi:MAG TPA: esterase family protein [Candidatus Mediterraneibacter cottocaccae]|nr:esterase family protein [Candidatus Mediterraneibacter cottocaccae]